MLFAVAGPVAYLLPVRWGEGRGRREEDAVLFATRVEERLGTSVYPLEETTDGRQTISEASVRIPSGGTSAPSRGFTQSQVIEAERQSRAEIAVDVS